VKNIELSPVADTFFPAELIYHLIDRQYLCRQGPKMVAIQYLQPGDG